jgi:hypothetical protein
VKVLRFDVKEGLTVVNLVWRGSDFENVGGAIGADLSESISRAATIHKG